VQGYVYNAWQRAADIYELWGESEQVQAALKASAYQRFNQRFWMEDEGFYDS